MASMQQKSHQTPSGVRYNYYKSSSPHDKSTILLLHGCPDSSSLWSDLLRNHLIPAHFGILCPDLIGYAMTDEPNDIHFYSLDRICEDLISLLDVESLPKVIVLGHDFGAVLASKMTSYHPDWISGLITLGTAHTPPSPEAFDFEKIRAMQEEYLGYCSGWYFPLYASEKGYDLMDKHVDRMFTALHGGGERMKALCCYPNAFENWLKQDGAEKAAVMPYASGGGFREEWIGRLRQDGFRAPMLWYSAVVASSNLKADQHARQEGHHIVKVPYLFVAALEDPLAPAVAVEDLTAQRVLADVTVEEVRAGHWLMVEKPDEVGEAVVGWLKKRF